MNGKVNALRKISVTSGRKIPTVYIIAVRHETVTAGSDKEFVEIFVEFVEF
jgi:hypothetical protein